LRLRIRAQQREEAAAPPYVAKALSGTNQAARSAGDDAVLLTARAHATADTAVRAALERTLRKPLSGRLSWSNASRR
ncbi:MAG: hypothetical protein ACRDTT_06485, partial [Pseudonocardiaceae bacterium]